MQQVSMSGDPSSSAHDSAADASAPEPIAASQDAPPATSVTEETSPQDQDNNARLEQLEREHSSLREEHETLRSQYMRIAADFDNFRKRQSRDQDDLKLPLPVTATVSEASLLGGDSQVALVTTGAPVPDNAPGPKAGNCRNRGVLCDGDSLPGKLGASLTSVTTSLEQLLDQAQKADLIPELVKSTKQFGTTSQDASRFLDTADVAAQNVDALVQQLRDEVARAQPTIDNLNKATAEAASAAASINNLAKAFDNPETVSDLKQTVTNARDLTARIDAVGGDIEQLTEDRQFMQGLRSVMIGLGAFFDEVYPAKTGTSE